MFHYVAVTMAQHVISEYVVKVLFNYAKVNVKRRNKKKEIKEEIKKATRRGEETKQNLKKLLDAGGHLDY